MTTASSDLGRRSPRIGISCGTQLQATAFGEQPTVSLNMRYVRAVALAGGLPFPLVPSGAGPADLIAALDGLVLTGGGDLDPASYGEERAEQVYGVDRERDDFEFALLAAAQHQRVPVLAICRGMQLINVDRSGTLIQHVADHDLHWQKTPSHEAAHPVNVDAGSTLAAVVGSDDLLVNSYHHQALGRLGEGLKVVADAGGLPEAFETTDGLLTAVQWHPEQMVEHHPRQLALFEALVAAAGRRTQPAPSPDPTPWSISHV